MSEDENVVVEPQDLYIRLDLGDELKYDTNVETVAEMVFWLETFKSLLIRRVFTDPEEAALEE